MDIKKCTSCGETKTIDQFYKKKRKNSVSLTSKCKKCLNKESAAYYRDRLKTDDEFKIRLNLKAKNWKKKIDKRFPFSAVQAVRYGGIENLEKLFQRAGNKCEICSIDEKLCVHHKDENGLDNLRKGKWINNNINNLQLLCISCHRRLHMKKRFALK